MEKDFSRIKKDILETLSKASKIIEEKKDLKVTRKGGNGNYVTSLDIKLESAITLELKKLYPEARIISEEADVSNAQSIDSTLQFVIDPLDGTSNYIKNWPATICIAAIFEDELVFGRYTRY